jgi:UDPglucose--hexose-1-phosphate uridylyltransferase
VIAPRRGSRPGPDAGCPFCEGHESETPPESLALGEGGEPDTPGWLVRVVPNLYPALERQEVVIHTPRHVESLADLSAEELRRIAEAWSLRAAAAREDGFAYLHAFVNEGAAAGASRPHSHSQLAWLRDPPPAVAAEEGAPRIDDDLVVAERDGVVAAVAWAGRLPYECVITPVIPESAAFGSAFLPAAIELLGDLVSRLRGLEGEIPLNAWIHDGPHWHLELVPRLSVQAGLELGAGISINSVAPEDAAERLRG